MSKMSFHDYMRSYANDHQNKVNKALHMVGIPMIVGSLPLIPLAPPVGLGLFTAGWTLQFVGHAFEGKKPSFASDLRYLAIGPVWAAVAWGELLTGQKLYEVRPETDAAAAPTPTATNGVAAAH
ncbi:MAG: DUF962 domain-containing protein [Deltaproteobacteria bacterium]|nr:DUF962 domain-containing protein [Deltaproteobacteria bacterium]